MQPQGLSLRLLTYYYIEEVMGLKVRTEATIFISFISILSITSLAIAHGWKAPKDAMQLKNPFTIDATNIQAGKELYSDFYST